MDNTDAILDAFEKSGYPVDLVQRSDGKWEVTVNLQGTPTTLFASATTPEAALEHAAKTIAPAILLIAFADFLQKRQPRRAMFEGRSSLTAELSVIPPSTSAEQFGGFGVQFRFHREPDGSFAWAAFDLTGRTALLSGVADNLDDAKLAALVDLLPPNTLEMPSES